MKSTGPRTPNGKKRISRNATRHGFFSKWLLIQGRDGRESQREYNNLCAGVQKHYVPVGWLEELWVEKIAVWSWRLRRLIRFERGQISLALARHSYDLRQSKADALAEPESAPLSNPEMDAMTDHLFLPEKEELDKLLRYEAMINRQLNHAIAELREGAGAQEGRGDPHQHVALLQNKAKKSFSFNIYNDFSRSSKAKSLSRLRMEAGVKEPLPHRGRSRDEAQSCRALPFPAWPLTAAIWPIHLAETSLKPGSVQAIASRAQTFTGQDMHSRAV